MIKFTNNDKELYFFESRNIKVFPCSYRGAASSVADSDSNNVTLPEQIFDPESRMPTEVNLTSSFSKVLPDGRTSYIIKEEIVDENTNTSKVCFVIDGYYFEVLLSAADRRILANKKLYIRKRTVTIASGGIDNERYSTILVSIPSTETAGAADQSTMYLDTKIELEEGTSYFFSGLVCVESKENLPELTSTDNYAGELALVLKVGQLKEAANQAVEKASEIILNRAALLVNETEDKIRLTVNIADNAALTINYGYVPNFFDGIILINWGDGLVNTYTSWYASVISNLAKNKVSHTYLQTGTYFVTIAFYHTDSYEKVYQSLVLPQIVTADNRCMLWANMFATSEDNTATGNNGLPAIIQLPDSRIDFLSNAFGIENTANLGNLLVTGCSFANWTSSYFADISSNPLNYAYTSVLANDYHLSPNITTELVINNIDTIAAYSLVNLRKLKKVTIGNRISQIGIGALYNSSSLEELVIPFVGRDTTRIDGHFGYIFGANSPDENYIYVPASIKKVTVTKASGITSKAFQDCASIVTISLPDTINAIYWGAFQGCNSLQSLTIPFVGASLVEAIDTHFGYIFGATDASKNKEVVPSSLKEVIITKATSIAFNAFLNCDMLQEIIIPDSVTSIGEYAFRYCRSLTNIVIPDGVTSIGDYAFESCSSLTEMTIPKNVSGTHGGWAQLFANCTALKKVKINIENDAYSLGKGEFDGCTSLETISISSSIIGIHEREFYSCDKLHTIIISASAKDKTWSSEAPWSAPNNPTVIWLGENAGPVTSDITTWSPVKVKETSDKYSNYAIQIKPSSASTGDTGFITFIIDN